MRDSTKIKYFTIAGTFTIIFTSYMLHAQTYYASLEPPQKVVTNTPSISEAVKIIEIEKVVKLEVQKPKIIQPKITNVEPKIVKEEIVEIVKSTEEVVTKKEIITVKTKKYIYISENSKVTDESKKIIENSLSKINSLDGEYYIDVEGYSASESSSVLSQQLSRKYAKVVAKYLKSIGVDKEIIVTSHSDMYPIIADRFDKRNSRVELKFRKGRN